MNLMIASLSRIAKLFVDDNVFAFAIIAWLGGAAWLLPHLPGAADWSAVLLFAGLACILLVGAHRAARARRAPRRPST
jgi:membrane protein implicated in regulation of membrane protease activity